MDLFLVSNCCKAPIRFKADDHIQCTKCKNPCYIMELKKEPYKMNSLLVSDCCKADIIIKKFDFVRCSKCDNPCKIIELDAESILNPDIPLHTRPSWNEYFLSITKLIASRSTCLRRQIGCVIVKENRILTTGYNGMPSGFVHCIDRGGCMREKENIPSGERLDYCFACHAESNAICQAAKFGISICGATVYLTNLPCTTCSKLIIQCKIKKVIYIDDYPSALTLQLFKESKTELIKYEEVK